MNYSLPSDEQWIHLHFLQKYLGRFASTKRIRVEIERDLTFWRNSVGLPEVVTFDSGWGAQVTISRLTLVQWFSYNAHGDGGEGTERCWGFMEKQFCVHHKELNGLVGGSLAIFDTDNEHDLRWRCCDLRFDPSIITRKLSCDILSNGFSSILLVGLRYHAL